jgi:hypothetical protein
LLSQRLKEIITISLSQKNVETEHAPSLLDVLETRNSNNPIFSTFRLIEKSAKDQADGKCSRTVPFPPTVGIAYARSIRARD